jgi:5'-nucleotidase / UDP-sugar diphosphatase
MRKSFAVKLILLLAMVVLLISFVLPNINIILSKIDKDNYKKITIFYTNDIHGHLMMDPPNRIMGMALVKHLIDENVDPGSRKILLDAGDTFYGSNETDINGGFPMINIMNKMNYAAMTVGNHEFDFGFEQTLKIMGKAKFPVLSANLYKNNGKVFKPYTVLRVNGIKIGIIGISCEDTINRTKPEYVKGVTIRNDIDTLNEALPEVKAKSDFIILLAHEHNEILRDIAKQFKDINLIIAGHDHVEIKGEECGNTYLVSSGLILRKLGKVDIVFKQKKAVYINGQLLSSDSKRGQDPEILAMINSYHDKIFKELNIKIGITETDLTDSSRARFEEVNFGNAIADAMRDAVNADIALQNGGGIRTNIPKGDLTLYKINEAFPFINYVIKVEMTGKDIKQALEHGVEKYPTEWNGGFLQVSGLKYIFNAAKPSGQRLVSALIANQEINDQKTYTVATNDFLYQGGDGYEIIKNSKLIWNTGLLIKDVFAEYVKQKKILNAGIEGRILILNPKT